MRLLGTPQAASLLGISPATLKLWRHQGKGPVFVKMGPSPQSAVGYDPDDLDAWVSERKYASTSAYTVANRPPPISRNCPPDRAST
ncbi:helix-turn-helix transcriptional regulator [Brevundimonas sp. UBA7838]|uniref:helix-turn-helix transcriptional regulator n=1 Tax=Brevundimonas sp. UBA7838 TaxID=1946142 RepID=UPI0025BDC472|nr:helix-turn-helix domain-containing protein [Brevundimonas sp. UBA7838]